MHPNGSKVANLFKLQLFTQSIRSATASENLYLKYSKTCLKRPLKKKAKIGFQDRLSLNAGPKYCRLLQGEQSAILSTFINLPFVIKIFVLFIFVWPLKTSYTVCDKAPTNLFNTETSKNVCCTHISENALTQKN